MKRIIEQLGGRLVLSIAVVIVAVSASYSQTAPEWPHNIYVPQGTITIYQPQLESFKGDKLTGRAAVSLTKKGETEPVFGAVWVTARVATDRDTRMVTCLDIDVTDVKAPGVPEAELGRLSRILEAELPKRELTISLDRLLAMLDVAEKEKAAAANLKFDPPKIMFTTHLAVLVVIDGEPELRKAENSNVMRVVNTPFFLALDPNTKVYYLKGGEMWFSAPQVKGPWWPTHSTPASIVALAASLASPEQEEEETGGDRIPQIIVSTEPAELIQSDGEPTYVPISGTDLLYVSNTEDDVFMHIGSQRYLALLSGRWFASASLDGKWSYVPSDKLPAAFAKIPPDSVKAEVLAHVAGTLQARESVLDTYIPQTATINRSEAQVKVVYDGQPKFVKIEGTTMYYAVNTGYPVIRVGNMYYCCHNAVWFAASDPLGPWGVCVEVPTVIYTIPPSCPHYQVKYVYVYGYTPSVVYVGYTPGYVGCYVYHGTVVYGTGYVYTGWRGAVYYPRPVTWGFSVRYNPRTGNWAFRVGRASPYGWVGFGGASVGGVRVGYARGGWWGGGGFRHVHVRVDRNIYRTQSVHRTSVSVSRTRNNVYVDRSGSVHRRTTTGWQSRSGGSWSSTTRTRTNLNRDASARTRGTVRTNQYGTAARRTTTTSRGTRTTTRVRRR